MGFLKYEFYNKLLEDVILLRVTPGVTWTQPYIYIYIYAMGSNYTFFKPLDLSISNG